jgi:hypothetical protein
MQKQLLEELNQIAIELSKGNRVKGWCAYKRHGKPLSAFYNKRIGWVVKCPVLILDQRTPLGVRVPTICLNMNWVAQPIVQKIDLKKAMIIIKTKLLGFEGIYPDLHTGNVGWYKGNAVMFDW